MFCYCGSIKKFEECCQLLLSGIENAKSPEQLMRSRYSAYVLKKSEYILNTYAKETRKNQSLNDINQWAGETKWLKLIVHHSSDFNSSAINASYEKHLLPTVEFSAIYSHKNQFYLFREVSRFAYEQNAWVYLDGDITKDESLKTPKRNEKCICGSNKKFKQCCAK